MRGIKFNYDSKYDILYLAIADKSHSYGDEKNNGLVIDRDIHTDSITGATIFDFIEKFNDNSLPQLPNCISVNIEKDIIPRIKKIQ